MNKIRVIAAIVDTSNLTLYKEDGQTVLIKQGDHRLAEILKLVKPIIARGEVAEINLDAILPEVPNNFSEFEKKSGGFVQFFKAAKVAVRKFLHLDDEDPAPPAEPVEPIEIGTENLKGDSAKPAPTLDQQIEEVMAHAIPSTSPDFNLAKEEMDTHQVVAVVTQKDGTKTAIPGAENLETLIKGANDSGNDVGLKALMQRLGAMTQKRGHSVDDLLKFLRRADLPLTVNGDIVIYKMLNKRVGGPHGLGFVDIHSGNVWQGPGALVQVDESLVDADRRNECSNGLHVARRGYLGSFSGSDCLLGIVRPEDVIAVPQYDANKMRVCAYHLVAHLSKEDFALVKSDNPIGKDNSASRQLAQIIAGNYPKPAIICNIGGHRGANMTYKVLGKAEDVKPSKHVDAVEALDLVEVGSPAEPAKPVDPKALAKEVKEIKEADTTAAVQQLAGTLSQVKETKAVKEKAKPAPVDKPAAEGTPRARIAALLASGKLDAELARQINDVKRAAKKGYDKLGVDAETEAKIKALL